MVWFPKVPDPYFISAPTLQLPYLKSKKGQAREAAEFKRLIGVAAPSTVEGVCPVNRYSAVGLRTAVLHCAVLFRREFGYDNIQWSPNYDRNGNKDALAYAWVQNFDYNEVPVRTRMLGACCFRLRRSSDNPRYWALQWVWLHPYLRHKGRLSELWPSLVKNHAPFLIEPPVSSAMARAAEANGAVTTASGLWMPASKGTP